MESIDVHAHIVLEDWFDDVRKDFPDAVPSLQKEEPTGLYSILANGKDAKTTRHVPETIINVRKRLQHLERLKIDLQMTAPVPALLYYEQPLEPAIALTRAQNDGIAQLSKDYPDVFQSLCSVPLQYPEESAKELERAVKKLGLKGVEIGTNVNGMNLDDKSLWPFYAKVEELKVPIMVHPFNVVGGGNRLSKYYLGNLIGNPVDTSIAIASVIFGGVFDDFPGLRFLFVHGGGLTPYQRGRLDHGYTVRPEPKEHISKKPSSYFGKIYIDTIVHYSPALEFLIKTAGADHIMIGSDYPFDMGPTNPVGELAKVKLSREDRELVSSKNAKRLFHLK